jgi:DNA-binding GntR family transcriptional regulator
MENKRIFYPSPGKDTYFSSLEQSATAKSTSLMNKIIEQIEIGILFGEYKPREHLIQYHLAKRYSVERNIIRAALKRLEEKGVIEHFANRGSIVKEFTAKNAKDLYRLRILLEGKAAEVAVENVTAQIIHRLEILCKDMEKNLQKNELKEFILAHEQFHQVIFETASNFYLLKIIRELISAAASIRYFSYSQYSLRETKKKLFEEHKQMVTLLKKRDRKKIGQLARAHIKGGINHFLRHFFPQESLLD